MLGPWSMNMKIDTNVQEIEKIKKEIETQTEEYKNQSESLIEELIEVDLT